MTAVARRQIRLRPVDLALVALALLLPLVAAWLLSWQLVAWQIPTPRVLLALVCIFAYGLLCRMTLFMPRALLKPAGNSATSLVADPATPTLVVHASQTGTAEDLASRTAKSLRAAGQMVRLLSLGDLRIDDLQNCQRALFLLATTGEGDVPDEGVPFVERAMEQRPDLSMLQYSLLALGDTCYVDYCGFARQFESWLQDCAANAERPRIEVDCEERGAIAAWHAQVQTLVGGTDSAEVELRPFTPWRLRARQLLNPGSAGMPCFHVELEPVDAQMHWQAGDIAQVRPRNGAARVQSFLAVMQLDGNQQVVLDDEPMRLSKALQQSELPLLPNCAGMDTTGLVASLKPLAPRSYSIASLPDEGALHLLVRQVEDASDRLGAASGWLTEYADSADEIDVRIGSNPRFRAPDDDRPLILIGNGTGIAGLLGLLRQRIANGQQRNWLLFGERHAKRDFFHADLLQGWHAQGHVEQLDVVFSRDQSQRTYVQHRLAAQASRLRQWVGEGADIVVCGSLQGMAPGVDAVLMQVLGAEMVGKLRAERRYRRDVY